MPFNCVIPTTPLIAILVPFCNPCPLDVTTAGLADVTPVIVLVAVSTKSSTAFVVTKLYELEPVTLTVSLGKNMPDKFSNLSLKVEATCPNIVAVAPEVAPVIASPAAGAAEAMLPDNLTYLSCEPLA